MLTSDPLPRVFVYILHSRKLVARAPNVERLRLAFEQTRFLDVVNHVEVVDTYEANEITNQNVREFVHLSNSGLATPFDALVGNLHVQQVSNSLKHYHALRRFVEQASSSKDVVLIVEDDVLFNDEAAKSVAFTLKRAPNSWTTIFLGLPCSVKAPPPGTDPGNVIFERLQTVFKVLPCCDSYLMTLDAAKSLLTPVGGDTGFLPIRFATNVHLSWRLQGCGILSDCHIACPNVFVDGSKLGVYTSSLVVNNRLSWNPQYVDLEAKIRRPLTPQYTDEVKADINKALDEIHFQMHPDIMFLKAIFQVRCGNYEEACKNMEKAYDLYQQNGCIINKGSEFLNAYCDVFRFLQKM